MQLVDFYTINSYMRSIGPLWGVGPRYFYPEQGYSREQSQKSQKINLLKKIKKPQKLSEKLRERLSGKNSKGCDRL